MSVIKILDNNIVRELAYKYKLAITAEKSAAADKTDAYDKIALELKANYPGLSDFVCGEYGFCITPDVPKRTFNKDIAQTMLSDDDFNSCFEDKLTKGKLTISGGK